MMMNLFQRASFSYAASIRKKESQEKRRDLFDAIANSLNIKKLDDWYNFSSKDIVTLNKTLLSKYDGSLFKALSTIYPEHQWIAWKFEESLPWGFWNDKSNQRKFFDWLAQQLNFKSQKDWYVLKRNDIYDFGGRSLIQLHYSNSVSKAIISIYPEYIWDENLFQETKIWQWNDKTQHRSFFEFLFKKLGYKDVSDWYKLDAQDIAQYEGNKLLELHYNGCYVQAITSIFPEHKLDPLGFKNLPKGFFKDSKNHKIFLEYVAKKMNLKKLDDWYTVSTSDFNDHRGGPLLRLFDYSLLRLLQSVYPDVLWKGFKMQTHVSKGLWQNKENRREYFDYLGEKLGIKHWSDWYKISKRQVVELGALSLLMSYYDDSIIKALQDIYPEHNWQVWQFVSQPDRWLDKEHQKAQLEHIGKELGIKQMEDWYQIKVQDVIRLGGSGLLEKYNKSLMNALKALYPDFNWKPEDHTFSVNKSLSKSQFQLFTILQNLTEEEIFVNFLLEDKKGRKIEVDIYIPSLNLAFEYQGVQHYESSTIFVHNLDERIQNDSEKAKIASEMGVCLIIVPYWWKATKEDILQIIQKEQPALKLVDGKLKFS